MLRPLSLVLGAAFLVVPTFAADGASPRDPAEHRIERIRKLLIEVEGQLDSLKREAKVSEEKEPLLGELLSERQKTLAKATRTPFRKSAMGYSFSQSIPFGFHYTEWIRPWGVRVEGGLIAADFARFAGGAVTGLYEINHYDAFELIEANLYGFGSLGYTWQRVENGVDIYDDWYAKPDQAVWSRIGLGTEIGFFNFGGIRIVPETGFQATQYIARYQDSQDYNSFLAGDRPQSDFELGPFVSLRLSFYFR